MLSEQRFIRSIPMIIIFTTMFMFWLWLMSLCWNKQMSLINLCHKPFVNENISPDRDISPISPLSNDLINLKPRPKKTIIISPIPQLIPQPILNDFKLLKPYLTYTVDGDTIREYKLFPEMFPKEKDHADRINYFHSQDFKALFAKYQLSSFPIKWTTNEENLGNREYTRDGRIKSKYGDYVSEVSKASYKVFHTNQPARTPIEMTEICEDGLTSSGERIEGFNNLCCGSLNPSKDYDFFYFNIGDSCPTSKYPYTRFITKNLECEFDWLKFILKSFEKHFPTFDFRVFNYSTYTPQEIKQFYENQNSDIKKIFTVNIIPKQIIVKEGTSDQRTETIDIIEIKYDLKTLVDKVNNLHLTTEKEKKNREFINQYALNI